jgi:oxygen-independent coproporphyrinogen-3 oxidase
VRTPERYLDLVERGEQPIGGEEVLDDETRAIEGLQLALRMRDGVPASALPVDELDGLVEVLGDRAVLTRTGRLLANEVALRLRVPVG